MKGKRESGIYLYGPKSFKLQEPLSLPIIFPTAVQFYKLYLKAVSTNKYTSCNRLLILSPHKVVITISERRSI